MMRMHPSSLQLDEQDQDHYSSTTKESTAINIVTQEVVVEEEEAAAGAASAVNTFNVNIEEEDQCYSDEEESLQVSDVELLMDNFSSALVSSILTMDSGYIEYVNDKKDNEDKSEFNKFEYYDCSTRNQDDQHILIRGYKLIDHICCSIGSGAIEVPVEEKEEEKGNEEAHSVVVGVTEVTSIASELNEVLLVPPPPTLVESTTFDEVATPLVDDADIVAAAGAAALNDAGDNNNNDAWFEQFSAGYEDLCCCVGSTTSTTSTTNTNTSSATSITKSTSENYVNNNGNDTINNTDNINNHEGLILYTEEDTPTKLTVIDNAVDQQLHKQQSMLSIDDDDDDDDDNYDDNTNGESVVVVPEPVAEVAEVLSDVQQGIVYSNMPLKKQPHSKEVHEKEEQEQVKEDDEGSELILDDPRSNCNTNVPLSSASSSSLSCGAQTQKSFMSTKTPLNSSKTPEKSSSTVTKVEKLKEHLRDMVRVRARAFPFKKTFSSSSSFGNKSNNNNSTHVLSALAPAPELLSPTEEFKPKKNKKQMKKKDKNHVMLSTSSTKKITNCASSKSFGRRKTSNAVNKRRPVLLSVTIEEEGHTENIIVAPLITKAAAANKNDDDDDDEECTDVLSAIPKLIVPKKRKCKHSGVTDDKTSVLSGITESNKSIHTRLRKEVSNDDQRDDADTSLFPEKSSSILNPYPVGGNGLGSGSGLGGSTFDSGADDDDVSSQLYSLGSSNDDESINQTEYRNKSKDYYGHHSISDGDYLKNDIYTVKPMHSGKQVKAGQLTL